MSNKLAFTSHSCVALEGLLSGVYLKVSLGFGAGGRPLERWKGCAREGLKLMECSFNVGKCNTVEDKGKT